MFSFIVFEGGEGSGKTTQANLLAQQLARFSLPFLVTYEPGGTALGNAIRRWIKTQSAVSPLTELFLFCAARSQHVEDIIKPALKEGRTVICDRFTGSTVAYQGYGRGLSLELIDHLNNQIIAEVRPSLTIFLDLPIQAGLNRKKENMKDRFHMENVAFHERVREGYLSQITRDPNGWLRIDATQRPQATASLIWESIKDGLSL